MSTAPVPFVIGVDPYRDEIARRLAAAEDLTFAGLEQTQQTHYRALAEAVVDYVGEDDFHLGCTSAELVEEQIEQAQEQAHDEGVERGFEYAKERIVAGIEKLIAASMVEAELAVELIPRITQMRWDDDPTSPGEPAAAKTPGVQEV